MKKLFGCFGFLCLGFVGFGIIFPMFYEIHEDPYGWWAMDALKKCDSDFNRGEFQEKYTIIPKVPDGNCSQVIEMRAISRDLYKYPTFIYNHQTEVKSCFHDREEERHYHGCTARKGGTWFKNKTW